MLETGLKKQHGTVNPVGAQDHEIRTYRVFSSAIDKPNPLRGVILNIDVFDLRFNADIEVRMVDNMLHGVKSGKFSLDRTPPASVRSATGVPRCDGTTQAAIRHD